MSFYHKLINPFQRQRRVAARFKMKITHITSTPLRIPYKKPYYWAQGIAEAAEVVLISVHTDEGITGYGESLCSVTAGVTQAYLDKASEICAGQNPFDSTALLKRTYQQLFAAANGNGSSPRFGALILSGLDMALWDVSGKAAARPVHELLGGAVRDRIQYFGFPQGETAQELAEEAKYWAEAGCSVIYVKIGRGEALDLEIAKQVRRSIGPKRLRLDANEAWDVLTAQRMIKSLSAFDVEYIEQPTHSDSLPALEQVKRSSPIPIGADQLVFTPEDVYSVCSRHAADLIVLGLHETGGITNFRKAAAIAEAAGRNVCLHGLYETGITTCAHNQVAATLTNLDDGNQFMNRFLKEDILEKPDLTLQQCALPVLKAPGLGFELNWDAVKRAEERYRIHHRS